jgi:uncharacterized C2H2 Zn-finger protein
MSTKKVYRLKEEEKPYICNKCSRGFTEERYLQRHLNRKTPCTSEFKCNKCDKVFKTKAMLLRHLNRKTPCSIEEVPVVTTENRENRCHMCGNYYSNRQNLNRHKKTCSVMQNPSQLIQLIAHQAETNQQLIEQNQQQQQTIQSLMAGLQTLQRPTSTTNNINIQQNNLYVNVTLCTFGKEDLSRLDTSKVMNMLKHHAKDRL